MHPKKSNRHTQRTTYQTAPIALKKQVADVAPQPQLELVLKCDTAGSLQAVKAALLAAISDITTLSFIKTGIGTINKSDLFMAETGSHLVLGFNVAVDLKTEALLKRWNVEIRLYKIIYHLVDDIKLLASSLCLSPDFTETDEILLGKARVVALFKSCRHGIIIGCEVEEGSLTLGQQFRIISAMGPTYSGRIESLHIKDEAVNQVHQGQQFGIKIKNFSKVQTGNLVESFKPTYRKPPRIWKPRNTIISL